jgi:Ser/Thr protein kinase RdoA (MazF antagonist)
LNKVNAIIGGMTKVANPLNEELLVRALENFYDLQVQTLEFLGRSDNLAYKISAADKKYLYKIHLGDTTKELISSELKWLLALNNETHLTVQVPIYNAEGELVSVIRNEEQESYCCTLQRWVDGKHIQGQPTEKEIYGLANLMATLHDHSSEWIVPQNFTRPIYDVSNVENSIKQLSVLLEEKVINAEDYNVLLNVSDKLKAVIIEQDINEHTWGIIHSDLHEGNYILRDGTAYAIDFSCCGFGFYLFDIAETFLHLNQENQKRFIRFYKKRRNLQENYKIVLEIFFLWQIIRNLSFLSQNKAEYEYLGQEIPYVVRNFCLHFLSGKRFLLN